MNKKELQVENWNLKHPVGTKVVVTKDDKSTVETITESEAEMLGGHTPVIWLAGFRGCYMLDRVKPMPEDTGEFSETAQTAFDAVKGIQ